MAESEKIKGICPSGKSFLIEPNKLFGRDLDDGLFVPPEDLNIYVELTTSKKERSVIDSDSTGVSGVSSEKGKNKVSFIDGTETGGVDADGNPKKSLTTSYTELTTVFNKTADTEKFGIKSIDIEFNSAYAPLIKIEFVDIRGASLFNTGNPPKSEYSSFFDLPYPIFTLKVKGYYGKTVKYCLHLTKWNARFNTKSGNFEITADFIGYTYAMLTDMLLGYLRAITKTDAGYNKFLEAKAEMLDPRELITINELLNKIQDVNEGIDKLEEQDTDIQELDDTQKLRDSISGLENTLKDTITKIQKPTDANTAGYAIFTSKITDGLIGVHHTDVDAKQNAADLLIFKESMTNQITNINGGLSDGDKLKTEDYTGVKSYNYFKYNGVYSATTTTSTTKFRNKWPLKGDGEFNTFRDNFSDLNKAQRWLNIDLFDFSKVKANIKKLKERLELKETKIKEDLGLKVQGTVTELLGFEPTIKNIFRIFTVHAEIFMECLKDVSKQAQDDLSGLRRAEFAKLKDKAFDIHRSDTTDTGTLPSTIYPWPLYREESDPKYNKAGNLEEAWLGQAVDNPENVPELVFVEDLLKGLLEVSKEDTERQNEVNNAGVVTDSWYPINPLDTPLFGVNQNPYKTLSIGDTTSPVDPLLLMMERAFIFMGVSNRNLYEEEIQAMATFEANAANVGIVNHDIKLAMLNLEDSDEAAVTTIIDTFLKGQDSNGRMVTTLLNGQPRSTRRPFMFENSVTDSGLKNKDYYYYKFIDGGNRKDQKFIPLNGDLHGSEFYDVDGKLLSPSEIKKTKLEGSGENLLFLSPPKTSLVGGVNTRPYYYGPTFMKIVSEDKYIAAEELKPNYETQNETLKAVNDKVKAKETDFPDYGTLYSVDRTVESDEDIGGLNVFGDASSRFAFTTISVINYTNPNSSGDEREIYYTETGNATAKAAFYTNSFPWGATALAQQEQFSIGTSKSRAFKDSISYRKGKLNEYEISEKAKFKFTPEGKTQEIYYPVRNGMGTRGKGPTNPSDKHIKNFFVASHKDGGKVRELFFEAEAQNGKDTTMIPHIDFMADDTTYSLFGSQLYFEQRRSSSPKTARAFLFLHTLPWNGLFVDDANVGSGGFNAGIFDNGDSDVLSNMFSRKAAFVNAPKLWCAFIGGVIWRNKGGKANPIDWEDDTRDRKDHSKLVPTYKGGSGEYDPIVWGYRISLDPQTSFNGAYVPHFAAGTTYTVDKFPLRGEYLTSVTASAPLRFDTSLVDYGDYKKISDVLKNLPLQIKEEFMKSFFEFVNSKEWEVVRENYEIFPREWDKPNADVASSIVYNDNGRAGASTSWTDGSAEWVTLYNNTNYLQNGVLATTSNDDATTNTTTEMDGTPIQASPTGFKGLLGNFKGIKASYVDANFPTAKENFEYIQPIRTNFRTAAEPGLGGIDGIYRNNWDIGYKNSDTNQVLTSLFTEGVWIANASYKPWVDHEAPKYKNFDHSIVVAKNNLELYVGAFVKEFKRITKVDTNLQEQKEELQKVFNTMDSDAIRLNIYRHCKTLYDKWIAGSQGDILTSCGTGNKTIDNATIGKHRKKDSKHRLIDSFRFVNRGFNDLGDTYLLNPKIINDVVVGNMNQSFYDLISRVLADNNFNFIALPAFIDYNDIDEMSALFKAEIFNQDVSDAVAGPTFVCVYGGQTSNKLDLGKDSTFPNDGFDFKCNKDGQLDVASLPKDFTKDKAAHEHNIVAFAVNYGHQNQNIFTDIKLDQQEFSETDESLQISDAIAQNGAQSNRTQAGQNLWNVYQVRSYSTEITAMGNAMIQPMMYFQLNNIPMFHGAYMIIKASHKIVPNHMTTTFKGVRTRFVDTPLIDSNTIYMSMLGNIGGGSSDGVTTLDRVGGGTGGGSTYSPKGSFPPIVGTIIENSGVNGAITQGTGNIKSKLIPQITGLDNVKLALPDENSILAEAVVPLEKMMKGWIAWMKANDFKGRDGKGKFYARIVSSFRSVAKQRQLAYEYRNEPGRAATPGSSRHGWGIALDLGFYNKKGSKIPSNRSSKFGFSVDTNPAIKWLYDNAYVYGFTIPPNLRDQQGTDEHWHWEYHGTSAKCMITEHPRIWGYDIDTSKPQDSSVTNPKGRTNMTATYTDCKHRTPVFYAEGLETESDYTRYDEGKSIITVPSDNTISKFGVVVVYGGNDYATPEFMLTQVEEVTKSLLESKIFIFVPYTNTWAETEALGTKAGAIIKDIKSTNTLDYSEFSLIGFSSGGQDVQQNLEKQNWRFIGLIDPYTNSTLMSGNLNSKTYMVYNEKNWSSVKVKADLPKLSARINGIKSGNSVKTSTIHEDIPKEFFKRYKNKI